MDTSQLKNPMRFSISHQSIDIVEEVDVSEIEIRPSTGDILVHWVNDGE